MNSPIARLRCAAQLSVVMTAAGAAADVAYEAGLVKFATQLENLREDAIKLHRDALELPPEASTAFAQLQDEFPF